MAESGGKDIDIVIYGDSLCEQIKILLWGEYIFAP